MDAIGNYPIEEMRNKRYILLGRYINPPVHPASLREKTLPTGDLIHFSSLMQACQQINVVFHVAALS